jgi:hypothetical protein
MFAKRCIATLVFVLAGTTLLATDLERRIAEASREGNTWIAWSVPSTVDGHMCCGEFYRSNFVGGRCKLSDADNSWYRNDEDEEPEPVARTTGRVWVRANRGEIDRIKMVSLDCEVDTSSVRTALLEDVEPAESVALLAAEIDEHGLRLADELLGVMATHADPAADAALERLLERGKDELRTKAAFWLAAERGSRGAQAVSNAFDAEEDADVRRELTFPLYISNREAANQKLIRAARRDPDSEVRKQALFWIAQRAGERATATLEEAVDEDPDSDVRQQAVFAISQLPPDRGVPLLIDLAREHSDPNVRRQAIFWLGQMDDPRAVDFLISLID